MAIEAQMYSSDHTPSNLLGFPLVLLTENYNEAAIGGLNSNVNNFCFNLQPQKRQQQSPPAHMQYLQLQQPSSLTARIDQEYYHHRFVHQPGNPPSTFSPSPSMASQMEDRKFDVDLLITLQYEKLRFAVKKQWKQQLGLMLKNFESKAQILLQQKDNEIAKGLHKMMELERLLKGMETENQTWLKLAKEHESLVASLNQTMQQLQAAAAPTHPPRDPSHGGGDGGGGAVEDAESCCDVENGLNDNRNGDDKMRCKICHSGKSSVILLPCRHLCCCDACEALIGSCPICRTVKKSTIHVLFS